MMAAMSALIEVLAAERLLAAGGAPLVLDVRWSLSGADPAGHERGHLPRAVFCDLDRDLAGPPGADGRHPLPGEAALLATFRRLGIGPRRHVLVYDGGAGAAAARAWWVLRWAGHEDVQVLDGGLAAWTAAGCALERGDVRPVPAPDAVVRIGSMPTVTADDVLAGRAGTLLDARVPERYRGETEPIDPVAGHIPGAVCRPTSALVRPDGRYRSPAELRTLLTPDGAPDGASQRTAYCGSGVTAAQLVLAGDVAGLDLALYPGSWSHWVQDPARPVAVGPE